MTINQVLKTAILKLKKAKITSANLDAEVLLSFILKKPKEFIFSHPENKLTKNQENKFKKLINRRVRGEPVAYLTRQKEFFGLDFYVDKRVLIPRPETELLVEEVIKKTQKHKNTKTQLNIADIGTGSGCIIITLAKTLSEIRDQRSKIGYYATDISKPALKVTKKNAKKHDVKIKFFQGDLLTPLKNKQIDIMVANLPYLEIKSPPAPPVRPLAEEGVATKWPRGWEKNQLKYEPPVALNGGRYGLEIYEKLFKQINELKYKPKIIFCEIGHPYLNQTRKLVKKYFIQVNWQIKKDLAGRNRVLIIDFKKTV